MLAIGEIYDLMWHTAIAAVFLWALYEAHIRQNCEETPQLDAKPSAADETASRAEILAQVMKPIDR